MAQKVESGQRFMNQVGSERTSSSRDAVTENAGGIEGILNAGSISGVNRQMDRRSSSAGLDHIVAILTSDDDRTLIEATNILGPQLAGLLVIATPDSEILKLDLSDVAIFLGDTSVESQAELCVQRTIQEFGRVDVLISVSRDQSINGELAYSFSMMSSESDMEDENESQSRNESGTGESEMRIREFDQLLYSKIRSVYLLSRFVRQAKARMHSTDRGDDFVLAKLKAIESMKSNEAKRQSPRQAVHCAAESWMKSYAEASVHGRWIEIQEIRELGSALSFRESSSSHATQ